MSTRLAVLIVEDSATDAALLVRHLEKHGYAVAHARVETAAEMRAALAADPWDAVLSDYKVPGFGAEPALALLHESGLDLPFLVVSGTIGEETAVALMKAGAHDFVIKGHMQRLAPALEREIREARVRHDHAQALAALRESELRFRSLVEQSLAGVYIVREGTIRYANRGLEQMFGYGPGGLVGVRSEDLIEKEELEVLQFARQRLDSGAGALSFQTRVRRRDGGVIAVAVAASRVEIGGEPATVGMVLDITERERAEEARERHLKELADAFMSVVEVAMRLGEMHDPYTAGHEMRVARIAVAIGAELGMSDAELEGISVAGHLHDIGKIVIPSTILSKPGKLSAIEYELVQAHVEASYDVLRNVRFPWPVAEIVRQHHERMDGSGYPRQLSGEEILPQARILAVADVVEAMSSHRPYRPGLGIESALAEIERGRGTVYDAPTADACLRLFREKGYALPD